jgi:multicomponent Na+:H+ antiporter subunit E
MEVTVKKASFADVLSTAVMCYIFWLLVTGQLVALIQGSPNIQSLIGGAVISIGVALFCARFFIHRSPFYLYNPVRLLTLLFYCLCVFMIELAKANIDVARRALSPKLPVNPGFVKVPSDMKSEYGRSMLANSITLTPGTITMDVTEEKGQTYYYIHWIDVATQDPREAGEAIKGTLEKWVRRIWE